MSLCITSKAAGIVRCCSLSTVFAKEKGRLFREGTKFNTCRRKEPSGFLLKVA